MGQDNNTALPNDYTCLLLLMCDSLCRSSRTCCCIAHQKADDRTLLHATFMLRLKDLHTLRAGYSEGCAGDATSQMHSSPSAAPDASRLGLKLLNSRPFTCTDVRCQSISCCCCCLSPRSNHAQQLSAADDLRLVAKAVGCEAVACIASPLKALTAPVCFGILVRSGLWPVASMIAEGFQRQMLPSAKPPAMMPYCRTCMSAICSWIVLLYMLRGTYW